MGCLRAQSGFTVMPRTLQPGPRWHPLPGPDWVTPVTLGRVGVHGDDQAGLMRRTLSACFLRWPALCGRRPMARVTAVRPDAVQRPGREDAPLVDLAAYRADDRKAG